jgi:hypothetical protein
MFTALVYFFSFSLQPSPFLFSDPKVRFSCIHRFLGISFSRCSLSWCPRIKRFLAVGFEEAAESGAAKIPYFPSGGDLCSLTTQPGLTHTATTPILVTASASCGRIFWQATGDCCFSPDENVIDMFVGLHRN